MNRGFRCLSLSLAAVVAEAADFTSPWLDCTASWIGNSYPGAKRWVQQDIRAMTVTPDGTVFTNVEWEEGGGNVGEYRAGELVRYARHTHGWGNLGGEAVAANSRHVFIGMQVHNEGGGLKDPDTWPGKGLKWLGVSRRLRADITQAAPFAGGKGGKGDTLKASFLVVAEVPDGVKAVLPGLCVDETRLYAADPQASQIKVYDADTMQPVTTWRVDRPGPLALSSSREVWMLQRKTASEPARLVRFNTNGAATAPAFGFPEAVVAVAFCFTPDGRVLVADDSPAQCLRLYTVSGGVLRESSTFGEPGGIYSGTPGAPGDRKFNHLTAIGCDAQGNLYVAHDGQSGGGGTVLESYQPGGKLNWRLHGLTFVDMADVDPASDTDVFTKEEHFQLDYAQPAGREWRYAGYTIHRFKYPQDPRLHLWSAGAWVRRIEGRRFLFVNDMNAERLQVYRFAPDSDGEIAIPSALFTGRRIKDQTGWPPHQPAQGSWQWRDANGNGAFDADEYEGGGSDMPAGQGWWVDRAGTIWMATETRGLRRFPLQGLDPHGNPRWPAAKMQVFPHPAEFSQVKRLRYEPATDTLYLGGTTQEHRNQHWKPMGPVVARYNGWLDGRRTLAWKIVAPYAAGSQGHTSCEPMGFDVAGDFIFVPYTGASKPHGVKTGRVEVFRAADGSAVGHFEPSEAIGEIGLQDIRETLCAHRRADGEYLVFLEDDYKAQVLMYRWKPATSP
jgi:hypothetical protein